MNTRTRVLLEESVLPPLVALVVALVAGDLLIMAYGQAPGVVWRMLLEGTWGNSYGFGQVLYKATTLTCTGLAVAIGLRAGLFNIGAEGQLALLNYVVSAKLHVPDTLHTPEIDAGAVSRLSATFTAFHGSAANWTILV